MNAENDSADRSGISTDRDSQDFPEFRSAALTELDRRGFVQQCSDPAALDRLMVEKKLTLYCGFDPTAASLHVGHMVPLFAMAHLARAGHRVLALIGEGTARIGDPTGRTETRKMLSVEEISRNGAALTEQIRSFFRAAEAPEQNVIVANNADWLAKLNYIDFLRDIGKHFSVNRMLTFETYRQRMETGLSFIEFNYQLLQSYDFLVLNRDFGVELQIGGDDQWGNIVAGIDLIRRTGGGSAYGLTFPLITRSDGKKMGKSEKGAVFLDPELCPPYDLFQYWRNTPDDDVLRFLRFFTFFPEERIQEIAADSAQNINTAKEILAYEYTRLIHGSREASAARETARSLFSAASPGTDRSAIPSISVDPGELEAGIGILELYARTDLCSSRGEARRLVVQGGARINDIPVSNPEKIVTISDLENGEILLKAGKKRYFRVTVEGVE